MPNWVALNGCLGLWGIRFRLAALGNSHEFRYEAVFSGIGFQPVFSCSSASSRRPSQRPLPQQMHMQVIDRLPAIFSTVDHQSIPI